MGEVPSRVEWRELNASHWNPSVWSIELPSFNLWCDYRTRPSYETSRPSLRLKYCCSLVGISWWNSGISSLSFVDIVSSLVNHPMTDFRVFSAANITPSPPPSDHTHSGERGSGCGTLKQKPLCKVYGWFASFKIVTTSSERCIPSGSPTGWHETPSVALCQTLGTNVNW